MSLMIRQQGHVIFWYDVSPVLTDWIFNNCKGTLWILFLFYPIMWCLSQNCTIEYLRKKGIVITTLLQSTLHSTVQLVRDSSDVRRFFVRLAGAMGRRSALHKENSGFAAPTLGWHISTFRGYQILFSIRNPYINRFTNHFSSHS